MGEQVTFGELIYGDNHPHHCLLTLLLGAPFLLPVPLPGLSVPFGLLILLVAVFGAVGAPPWLPRVLADRPLSAELVRKLLHRMEKMTLRLEFVLHPRWTWLFHPVVCAIAYGFIALGGLALALPLPPGTNAPPAALVVLFSLALLERDGWALILGFCALGAVTGLTVYYAPYLIDFTLQVAMKWLG